MTLCLRRPVEAFGVLRTIQTLSMPMGLERKQVLLFTQGLALAFTVKCILSRACTDTHCVERLLAEVRHLVDLTHAILLNTTGAFSG